MDGLPHLAPNDASVSDRSDHQRTLKAAIGCVGVGLHSGCRVEVTLRPAPAGSGVVFRRVDLGLDLPARFDHVADTRLCTVLALPDRPDVCVGTIEHLMAALSALGVGNVVVEVDGPELPVLDGSAAPWLFLLDCAGLAALDAPASVVEVLRPVRVEDGEAFAELRPSRSPLDLTMAIEFDAAAIGRQALTLQLDEGAFRQELAAARTFTQVHEVAGLQAAGLARGHVGGGRLRDGELGAAPELDAEVEATAEGGQAAGEDEQQGGEGEPPPPALDERVGDAALVEGVAPVGEAVHWTSSWRRRSARRRSAIVMGGAVRERRPPPAWTP